MPSGPSFSLLVKPASADCNLRCRYCFYLPKQSLYPSTRVHRMSLEVLERLVSSYLDTDQPQYSFGWQGGEPTLMGSEFFRHVTRLQRLHGRPGAVVANGLQTNGTLIDEPLARHLARYRFLVGVSVDGPPELHDAYRTDASGGPSFARVLRGVQVLRKYGVEHNVLALVNDRTVTEGRRVYRFLKEQGFLFHQYIPCVERDAQGRLAGYAIGAEQWGRFLCELFDEWYPADVSRVSVRLFDSILVRLVEGVANVCHMGRDCRQYFLVEHNGDVYPCDFFVEERSRLGNIMETGWRELLDSPAFAAFGARKSETHAACASCEYDFLCGGDCLKHRGGWEADPRALSQLCEGWRIFYAHALPALRQIAGQLRAERGAASTPRQAAPVRAGRNDPCPCGSGRKYKSCCGSRL